MHPIPAGKPPKRLRKTESVGPLLTPAARRYIQGMLQAIRPEADRLDREFRRWLNRNPAGTHGRVGSLPLPPGQASRGVRPCDARDARQAALVGISPAAASRLPSLARFFGQVDRSGRLLAKLGVSPEEIDAALDGLEEQLAAALKGAFEPAREQLRLATVLALRRAYYETRQSEAQVFFELYQAELDSSCLEELPRRFVAVLVRALRARSGRMRLLEGAGNAALRGPLYVESGRRNERLIAPELRGRYASYWSYPVGAGAAIQIGFSDYRPWLPGELALLDAAANRCWQAVERARLQNELRRLSAERLRAEEEERRRIGRELHDEAGQSLLFLRLKLEMLERAAPRSVAPALGEAREIAERTVLEIRRIIAALSPSVLDRLGLPAALRRLGERFRAVHPCDLRIRISGAAERLPKEQQEAIYRIAQESLQNVAKHSGATRVMLALGTADRETRLSVKDNGAGFSAENKDREDSLGLTGMHERAALHGGKLAVRSAPGKGAVVMLVLPRQSAGEKRYAKDSRTAD